MNEPTEFLETLEGPDGQECRLLTRVTYPRQRLIEQHMARARTTNDQADACFRGLLWSIKARDILTGEMTDDPDADIAAEVIQPWRMRAVDIYNEWYAAAFPGPKGSTGTGRRTRNTAKSSAPSETDGRE